MLRLFFVCCIFSDKRFELHLLVFFTGALYSEMNPNLVKKVVVSVMVCW